MDRIRRFIAIIIVMTFGLITVLPVGFAVKAVEVSSPYVDGVVLIQYEKDLPEAAKADLMKSEGLSPVKKLGNHGLELVKINDGKPIETVLEKLNKKHGIVYAEPDYLLQPTVTPSDDPYYNLLWGIHNTGQIVNGVYGTADIDIDGPEAWALESGENTVVVAVIDTAVEATHPDLAANLLPGVKFGTGTTVYDHGTHVSGTIAGVDNSIGVIGIAPNVKILPLEFLGKTGGSTSDAIAAIQYATGKADIINASWGGGGFSLSLKNAIEAFKGPFVAAAGNSGVNSDATMFYPADYTSDNIISVAAIDSKGALASFSNYGLTTVDVGAPGVSIASTYLGASYSYMNGTSMAAPHVSGVLALMKSYAPNNSTETLKNVLMNSGVPMASLAGKTVSGKMINAYNALMALVPPIDETAPLFEETIPVIGATNVALNTEISVQFNEAVQLMPNHGITIDGVDANAVAVGNKVLITPTTALSYNETYVVNVPQAVVKDLAGNAYNSVISFDFTTELEPVVTNILFTGTMPTEGADTVKRAQTISFFTDQIFTNINMNKITFKDISGNVIKFTASGVGTKELRIKSSAKMGANVNYQITLSIGAVSSGTALSVPKELNFKTGSR